MNVLVTGATGFVGRRLVARLAALGHSITALARNAAEGETGWPREKVTIIAADLERFDPRCLPRQVDAVIALAQSRHFREFPALAEEVFAVNVLATLRLFQWARQAGVGRFILASSGGIYGDRARPYVEETDLLAVDSPLGFYLATKLCSEVLFQNFRHFFEGAVILRPFFIYGPGQRQDMLVPRLIESVRTNRPVHLSGDEGLRMNPIFVADAVEAFVRALSLDGCHVINVAGPEVVTLKGFVEKIAKLLGLTPVFQRIGGRASDYVADIGRMRIALGAPTTGIEEGLMRTLKPDS